MLGPVRKVFSSKIKGGVQKGVSFLDFCICSRLSAFARVWRAYLRFVPLFREPEICVCLRMRSFVCVRFRLQTPPFIAPPSAAP